MQFEQFLELLVNRGGSDLFISAGAPPSIKINGELTPLTDQPLSPEQTREMVLGVMDESLIERFTQEHECNFAISASGIGRFRVSAFYQRNLVGMVLRRIETTIPTLEQLKLPEVLKPLVMAKRGLVLFVGATGTGKSTSLAALINHRNHNTSGHILCVEDPIEFMHRHQKSLITQREVGLDTESFEVALKNALRQAPDVIMIGEVRTRDAMRYALTFADTGHLCLATLHASNADQALERIINFFPADEHHQIWLDLSLHLKGIVAQQLVKNADGNGRSAVIEVLLNTPLVSDQIRKGEVKALKELMKRSTQHGMQTFDQALFRLYRSGTIRYEDALHHADSPNDLRLMIKLDAETNNQRVMDNIGERLSFTLDGDDD
ncbi:type IV pili twitching motility protein PilT [Ventosimonas gracilis]|uniref:Type IV pili twitching motility protein PilT n=1 Tax=Ventosimonas gracilis TaxID=1680762 RepID=A0A139STU8_9GAMM|nr:PilT/PilU family type 4a pilus ATPase [Ventosimonas gracilis]KXU38028.1 type IV pili twitching motility protein PilT [Ventosimonas gracilis]